VGEAGRGGLSVFWEFEGPHMLWDVSFELSVVQRSTEFDPYCIAITLQESR